MDLKYEPSSEPNNPDFLKQQGRKTSPRRAPIAALCRPPPRAWGHALRRPLAFRRRRCASLVPLPNTVEQIPTLVALFPRGGPVQDPVLACFTRSNKCWTRPRGCWAHMYGCWTHPNKCWARPRDLPGLGSTPCVGRQRFDADGVLVGWGLGVGGEGVGVWG